MRILVVEADELMGLTLVQQLTTQQYAVSLVTDGESALQLTEDWDYDLILLDIALPAIDGLAVCQQLRSQGYDSPILFLTAQASPADRVRGLDAGADDYLVKPFDLAELLARIRALMRRGSTEKAAVLIWENVQIDPRTNRVTCDGQPLALTPKEYAVIELFLRNPKRVFSRSNILDRLWDFADCPGEETVSSHIYSLRQKLKAAGSADFIETVYGLGYRLRAPATAVEPRRAAPVTPPAIRPASPVSQPAAPPGPDCARLLILDADRLGAEAMRLEATLWGLQAEVATDPIVARMIVAQHPPDAVLLDLDFPGSVVEGFTLLRELTDRWPRLPVLIYTTRMSLADRLALVRLVRSANFQPSSNFLEN
jgi:DNA-binding response OmpR family regulator